VRAILGMASAGVPPRIMGIGPVPSTRKLMERLGREDRDFDVIELNEAFASQGLACMRQLGVADDAEHVNPNGGAIALGHPLGMSGARLALTAAHQLAKIGGRRALATMCVGVRSGRVAGDGARLGSAQRRQRSDRVRAAARDVEQAEGGRDHHVLLEVRRLHHAHLGGALPKAVRDERRDDREREQARDWPSCRENPTR
jgi:hypothetical protein